MFNNPIKKKYLITSHPRSGTGYMAELFQVNGIDIIHEEMGKDGISSWMFAVDARPYPYNHTNIRRSKFEFEEVIHVIRDPFWTMNSVAFTEHGSESFRKKHVEIAGNIFERACMSVINWHKLIQRQKPAHTIKTESAAKYFGFEYDVPPQNQREHSVLSWDDYMSLLNSDLQYKFKSFYEFYNKLP